MARQIDKKAGGDDWQGSPFGNEDIEFSPFMFDAGEGDTGAIAANAAAGPSSSSGGQFSDADMEFEPFMFDSGTGGLPNLQPADASAPNNNTFASFHTTPFGDPVPAGNASKTPTSPITGGNLPLPSYLTPSQPLAPEMVSAPLSPSVPASPATSPRLATVTEPSLTLPQSSEPGMGMGMREQMTGRAPSGPLAELPDAPVSAPAAPVPSAPSAPSAMSSSASPFNTTPSVGMVGRVRGNTGPLGPLPPDRIGASNTSWSDSSLASIEDFSSILIALRAGKRLRQSGPLHDSMIGQSSATAVQDAPPVSTPTQDTMPPVAPVSTPEHMGVATQAQNMPEWAVQATQSGSLAPEMVAAPVAEAPGRLETRPPSVQADTVPNASTDFAGAAGEWEPNLPATSDAPAVSEPEASVAAPAEPAPIVVEEVPDPIQYHQMPADSILSHVDANVAEALKSMDSSVAPANMSGDDIEFEGFMFNKGASTPMSSLPAPSAEELASMSHDFGPAFDPTPYSVADTTENDSEDSISYDDVPSSLFDDAPASAPVAASPAPVPDAPADTDATGGLPFWLQFDDSPNASGPLAESDIPGISASMNAAPQNYYPATGSDSSYASQYSPSTSQSGSDASSAASQNDFADLPPIEPFDFSLMPTTEPDETLGFNTEELSGLISGGNDPMTATVNLAAVADLLGNTTSGPLDTTSPALSSTYENYPAEAETVSSLNAMEPWSTSDQSTSAWDNPPDFSTLKPSDTSYAQAEPEEPISRPLWSQDVAPDLGLDTDATSLALDNTAVAETPASTEPVASSPVSEPLDSTSMFPTDSSLATGGWMATATSGLSMETIQDALAQNSGELADDSSVEQNLPTDMLNVAPFDFTQIEQVDEESPTGYLDAEQMKKNYGTASLEMPDDATGNLASHPAVDNWSAEGDTSYFASTPVDEAEDTSAQFSGPSSFTEPLSGYSHQSSSSDATDYLDETEDVAAPAPVEAQQSAQAPEEYSAAPAAAAAASLAEEMHQAPTVPATPDVSQETEPETIIKARVARGPWTSYTDTADYSLPAPQLQTKPQQTTHTPTTTQPTTASNSPHFEQSVRLPADFDVTSTGPLPSLTGFEDLIGWVASNPQDIGAHMALASAYAQHEDIDSALRIYRRIIKKPTTSDTMLKMIWDDLSDLNDQAHHMPRYHQLSGDLLLRLGRHKEAVEAYNRLQTHEEG